MSQLTKLKKPTPRGKPVRPKKPPPTQEAPARIPVPCSLTEKRVREIAREEIIKWGRKPLAPLSEKSYHP